MRRFLLLRTVAVALLTMAATLAIAQQQISQHLFFHVTLSQEFQRPVSGRLLLFVALGHGAKAVDMDMTSPTSVYIAAKEITDLNPGQTVDIDADDTVFPAPLSHASRGDYQAQLVLDVAHTYNYSGRQPGDLISPVLDLRAWNPLTGTAPSLTLSALVPQPPDPLAHEPEVNAALKPVDFISPAVSRFWGRDVHMRAWVLLPPGYNAHPQDHYPTVYIHARLWRQSGKHARTERSSSLSAHEERQDASNDLGASRPEQSHRHTRVRRWCEQWPLGHCAHLGTDSLA